MTKLLPCPFGCKGVLGLVEVEEEDDEYCFFNCEDCGAHGPLADCPEEARKLWNQRERHEVHSAAPREVSDENIKEAHEGWQGYNTRLFNTWPVWRDAIAWYRAALEPK